MNWWEHRPVHEARPTRGAHLRPSVSKICRQLLIGEYPRPEDIEWLKREHRVSAVHNLQDEEDLRLNGLDIGRMRELYHSHGIKLVRTPIPDGSADAMADHLANALAELHRLIAADERVYLHCNAGLNRAPTLTIAYLRAYEGMSLDEALHHVKRRRACGPFMTVLEEHFGPRDFKPDR
jgi:protein-tyrosine phosphatase